MSDAPEIPQDDSALAAEYVLRLLDAEEERAFENRLLSDSDLRDQVRMWEAKFASLADALPETTPPASIKVRLMDKIAGTHERTGSAIWRWLLPSAVALAVIGFLAFGPLLRGPDFDPAYHASLITADGSLQIEAGLSPDNTLFKVLRPIGDARPGRVLEIWVIAEGADAPVSLGVLPEDRETLFEIDPDLAALIEGGVMAVSDEPPGGSPTGAPTGEVLATGEFFDV